MTGPPPPPWPASRIVVWGVVAGVCLAVIGPTYARAFLPPDGAYTDFAQEWLSSRNFFAGDPVYQDVPASARRHLPDRRPADEVIGAIEYNAHPPVAVLVALPFGLLSYPAAHLTWNLATYGLFLAAAAVAVRELGVPFAWPAVFPAVVLLLGNPLLNQVYQGQMNCLLAALLVAAWDADRRGRPGLAGAAVGLAGAVKLFPLFLLVYFAFGRRWAGLAAGVAAFLAANALAAAVFGAGPFRDYAAWVVPAVAGQFQGSWHNLSLTGFWVRLAGTDPVRGWAGAAVAGPVLAKGLSLVVVGLTAWACWRAETRDERDRAFALAVVGMLLVSPLTWPHYFPLLLLPLGVAGARARAGPGLWALGAAAAVLWLPPGFAARVGLALRGGRTLLDGRETLTTADDLAMVSVPHYALLALFLLVLRLPPGRRPGVEPPPGGP